MRNSGCRITDDLIYKGYRSLLLENDQLLIQLLLDKGGEPIRWLHKPTDTDLIWLTDAGLTPPHSVYADYQSSYIGGWQEMFPEVSRTSEYAGGLVHRGESAITPWDAVITKDDPEEIEVLLIHRLRSLPLRTEKRITLRAGSALVRIEETMLNCSPVASIDVNWGHHLAYGLPFLGRDARIEFAEGARVCQPATGEQWPWPYMTKDGARTDLSALPPPGTPRELLYVLPKTAAYRIASPSRGLAAEVRWNGDVWPYVWYWQNFRADKDAPFFGCEYNIGLEMFNIPPKLTLAEAAAQGSALTISPSGRLTSWLEIELQPLSNRNEIDRKGASR